MCGHEIDGAGTDVYVAQRDEAGYLDADYGCCPACGDPIDYCQGHGEIGDPAGFAILMAHDDGDHSGCHPDGCEEAPSGKG